MRHLEDISVCISHYMLYENNVKVHMALSSSGLGGLVLSQITNVRIIQESLDFYKF